MLGKEFSWEALIAELAAKLKEQRLDGHVRHLRGCYRGFLARRRAALLAPSGKQPWTEDHVLHLAALLQPPPLDHVYERRSRCTCGADPSRDAIAGIVLGNEARSWQCMACKRMWLRGK